MTRHDYLVLSIAVIWLVTIFLGAAFTIHRVYDRWKRYPYKHHGDHFGVLFSWRGFGEMIPQVGSLLIDMRTRTKRHLTKVYSYVILVLYSAAHLLANLVHQIVNFFHN
jgi:hypothetical protein